MASIASKSYYLDYINACTATIDMSEEDRNEEAISYLESQDEDLQGVGVYKIGSVILVDSGAAFTSICPFNITFPFVLISIQCFHLHTLI